MRASLLLIAVRTGTAIVVSTAAVQFWAIAVKGETPRLTPSIALPQTATAVAAVMPHRSAKSHGSKHKAHPKSKPHAKSAQAQPAVPSPQPATTAPVVPAVAPHPAQPAATRPTPVTQPSTSPRQATKPRATPTPIRADPAPAQPVLTRPPAFPQLAPVAPPPPPTDD